VQTNTKCQELCYSNEVHVEISIIFIEQIYHMAILEKLGNRDQNSNLCIRDLLIDHMNKMINRSAAVVPYLAR
jgi:hypothetical protein